MVRSINDQCPGMNNSQDLHFMDQMKYFDVASYYRSSTLSSELIKYSSYAFKS